MPLVPAHLQRPSLAAEADLYKYGTLVGAPAVCSALPPRRKRKTAARECGRGVRCWARPGSNSPALRGRRKASLARFNACDHQSWSCHTGSIRESVAASDAI